MTVEELDAMEAAVTVGIDENAEWVVALVAEVRRLRELLKPFASYYEDNAEAAFGDPPRLEMTPLLSDVRAAHEALNEK